MVERWRAKLLFYFREAARPYLRSLAYTPSSNATLVIPLRSSRTASCLVCASCCCCRAFRRENCSKAANLSAIAEELHQCLGACYHLSSAHNLKLHNPTHRHSKMAARTSIARAARQFTSAAARRPSPFVCQRWQQATQQQRLFSVSAACTHT
jgi:hypothetical protein